MGNRLIMYSLMQIILAIFYGIAYRLNLLNIDTIGLLCLLQLIFVLYSWYNIKKVYIDAYIIFSIALYTFNLGQPILRGLHLAVDYRNLIDGGYISETSFFQGAVFSLLCLCFLHLGALASQRNRYHSSDQPLDSFIFVSQINIIKKVSFFFLIFSMPFYLIFLYQSIGNVMIGGYSALYEEGNTKGSFWLLSNFYTPSLIALYFTSQFKPGWMKYFILLIMVLTVILPPLFLGGRTDVFIILSIVFLIYFYTHKLNLRYVVLAGLFSMVFLNLFHAISVNRTDFQTMISSFSTTVGDGENPALSTISEMGWTMFCTSKTMDCYPSIKEHEYGTSYIGDLLVVIPNLGFWDEHPSNKYSSSKWLQEFVGGRSGIGYSMPAEAYANFGWFGMTLLFVLGYIYTRIYDRTSYDMIRINPLMVVIGLIFLWFTVSTVRNSLHTLVRAILYYIIPMYLVINFKLKQRCLK